MHITIFRPTLRAFMFGLLAFLATSTNAEDLVIYKLGEMIDSRPEFDMQTREGKKRLPAYDKKLYLLCKECVAARIAKGTYFNLNEGDEWIYYPIEYLGVYGADAEAEALTLTCVLSNIGLSRALDSYLKIAVRRSMIENRELQLADEFLNRWSFHDGIAFGQPHRLLRDFPITGYRTLFDKWIPLIIFKKTPGAPEDPSTPPPKHDPNNPLAGFDPNAPHHSIQPALEMIYLLQISGSSEDNKSGEHWAKVLYEKWGNTKGWSEITEYLGWYRSVFPEFGGKSKIEYLPSGSELNTMKQSIKIVGPTPISTILLWVFVTLSLIGFLIFKSVRKRGEPVRRCESS